MKIYTSYFGQLKKLKAAGIVPVSIAGKNPDWFNDSDGTFSFKLFCPKWEWWKVWHDKFKDNLESCESKNWYTKKYNETVLSTLDADGVVSMLKHTFAGKDIALLCYEVPTKFCHRHIVANWITDNAGIEVSEFQA